MFFSKLDISISIFSILPFICKKKNAVQRNYNMCFQTFYVRARRNIRTGAGFCFVCCLGFFKLIVVLQFYLPVLSTRGTNWNFRPSFIQCRLNICSQKSMTIKKNQCITMHVVDYSLQTTVNIAVQNCALFMYLRVLLWKKAGFALQGHTHTCGFLA